MPGDLEAQLRASLPGRETAVQDYAALHVALARIEDAIESLGKAGRITSMILGADRKAVDLAADAAITAHKAKLDLERAIKAHPAGRKR
jgi:hypothetical protein